MLTVTRALAFSLLLASTARAAGSGECVPGEPITDSAGYAVAATSAGRYMQLASAASYAERAILPSLTQGVLREKKSGPPLGGVLGERMNLLWGIGDVPIGVSDDGGCKVGLAPFDLYSGNLGLGFSVGPVYAFYATSMAIASAGDIPNRLLSPIGIPLVGGVYSLIGPVVGSSSGTTYGMIYSLDYIGGAGFATRWVTGAAGYAGSKGFFGHLTQPDLKLFVASAVRSSAEVAYLRAGAELVKLTKDQVTATTLFFRQVAQAPVTGTLGAEPDLKPTSFRTLHVEQVDLFSIVDVTAAYGFGEFQNLHEASLRVHTPGYFQQPSDDGGKPRWGLVGGALTVGLVRVPERRILGQSGKPLPHVALEFGGRSPDGPSRALVSLRINDPEILALFPAAGGSVNLTLEGAFGN